MARSSSPAAPSSSEVPRAVASVLDVKESVGRTLTESIVTALQSRRALLVLDNCEHVIDGAARPGPGRRRGLPGRPGARHLERRPRPPRRTARRRRAAGAGGAGCRAVQRAGIGGLVGRSTRPPAGTTSRRSAAASTASRSPSSWPPPRTRSLSPAELVERLDDRLRLLTGGRRASVERHRTLRATIQWSYDLLTPPQQAMFRRLSIFAGPFDRVAAEATSPRTGPDLDRRRRRSAR